MKRRLLGIAAVIPMLLSAAAARAQAPVFSFETIIAPNGPDGFFGLGATVSQDTIGATAGTFSLKYDVGNGGFVGARTEAPSALPVTLNDPPGVVAVLFDVTLPTAYGGTFADIGVTVFGHQLNAPVQSFGNQVQFADTVSLAVLGAGTHLNQRIDLDFSQGPFGFGQSFNAIFGPGVNDLSVASGFQFYISKNALTPITLYIDNVRLVSIPEPATASLVGLAGLAIVGIWRRPRV